LTPRRAWGTSQAMIRSTSTHPTAKTAQATPQGGRAAHVARYGFYFAWFPTGAGGVA